MSSSVPRVTATAATEDLLRTLQAEHGPVLFHQSGGCCDGSSPMCYPQSEFIVGDSDVRLGAIAGVPFYMSRTQFEYWQHTQLIIDVVAGRGGMFSLENGREVRFLTRSRLFTEEEAAHLESVTSASQPEAVTSPESRIPTRTDNDACQRTSRGVAPWARRGLCGPTATGRARAAPGAGGSGPACVRSRH